MIASTEPSGDDHSGITPNLLISDSDNVIIGLIDRAAAVASLKGKSTRIINVASSSESTLRAAVSKRWETLVLATWDGSVHAYDLQSLNEIWCRTDFNEVRSVVIFDDEPQLLVEGSRTERVDLSDGSTIRPEAYYAVRSSGGRFYCLWNSHVVVVHGATATPVELPTDLYRHGVNSGLAFSDCVMFSVWNGDELMLHDLRDGTLIRSMHVTQYGDIGPVVWNSVKDEFILVSGDSSLNHREDRSEPRRCLLSCGTKLSFVQELSGLPAASTHTFAQNGNIVVDSVGRVFRCIDGYPLQQIAFF